jgi:hypothetical protein
MLQKFFSTALLAVALLVSITACKKSDDSTPSNEIAAGMKATVDGKVWSSTTTAFYDTVSHGTEIWGVNQIDSNSNIGFKFICPKQTGTYTFTNDIYNTTKVALYFEGDNFWASNSGTLTITSLSSKNIKGTFSFAGSIVQGNANAIKTITNGSFNINK